MGKMAHTLMCERLHDFAAALAEEAECSKDMSWAKELRVIVENMNHIASTLYVATLAGDKDYTRHA